MRAIISLAMGLALACAAMAAPKEAPLLQYSVNNVVFGWNLAEKSISVDQISTLSGPLTADAGDDKEVTRIPVSKDGSSYFQLALPPKKLAATNLAASLSGALEARAREDEPGVSLQEVMSRTPASPTQESVPGLEGRTWKYIRRGVLVDEGPLWEIKGLAGLFLANDPPDVADLSPLADLRDLDGARLWLDLSGNRMIEPDALAGLVRCWWLYLTGDGLSNVTALASLKELRSLHLSDNPVVDLKPLAGLPNLKRLYLSGTGIRDLSPLAGMKGLTGLDLSGNGLKDAAPVAGLENLEWLHLGGNPVTSVSPLKALRNLRLLNLGAAGITDLAPLTGMTNLTVLHLPANGITDVGPLASLPNLRTLNLGGNAISNVQALAGMKHLAVLHLNGNRIADAAPLAGLESIETLNLAQNEIRDLSFLGELKRVKSLYLFGNKIEDLDPLLKRGVLGKGDSVWLVGNPLSGEAREKQIPALKSRGVEVHF